MAAAAAVRQMEVTYAVCWSTKAVRKGGPSTSVILSLARHSSKPRQERKRVRESDTGRLWVEMHGAGAEASKRLAIIGRGVQHNILELWRRTRLFHLPLPLCVCVWVCV